MRSKASRVIVAPAGSGKTTLLVDEALSRQPKRIAVLTYTNSNARVVQDMFVARQRGTPSCIEIWTWFRFLLQECARPYQRAVYSEKRIKTIHFTNSRSARYTPYENTQAYYFQNGDEVYSDKISRFVLDCERLTAGRVTQRLATIYDAILIDEFQDLAGYDLDVLEMLMTSGVPLVLVGDPRQTTYLTNPAAKNKQYRGIGILKKVRDWEKAGLCEVEVYASSWRCNQAICNFADRLWPQLDGTASTCAEQTGHDGIFLVAKKDLSAYISAFAPQVLRYSKTTDALGYPALTFGNSKGMTVDRVLILPHGPIQKYLRKGNPSDVRGSLYKFYVAVTRARYSVAFLHDGACWEQFPYWKAPGSPGA